MRALYRFGVVIINPSIVLILFPLTSIRTPPARIDTTGHYLPSLLPPLSRDRPQTNIRIDEGTSPQLTHHHLLQRTTGHEQATTLGIEEQSHLSIDWIRYVFYFILKNERRREQSTLSRTKMSKLKVYVHYEGDEEGREATKLKITVPKSWRTNGKVSKVKTFFVTSYNTKHASTTPLDANEMRISRKVGPPLDANPIGECLRPYDDLYVRARKAKTVVTSAPAAIDRIVRSEKLSNGSRKKDFDEKYNQWDSLVCSSDDDEDCHPNIEKMTWRRLRKQQRKDKREKQEKRLTELKELTNIKNAEIVDAKAILKTAEEGSTKYKRATAEITRAEALLRQYEKEETSIRKRMKKTLEDVCVVTEERTVVSNDVSVKPVPSAPTKEKESEALESFIKNHDERLQTYISYAHRSYEDNKNFLIQNPALICGECTGWLLLRSLEAEMAGDSKKMKDIVKQYLQLQTVMDLGKSTEKDPRDFILRFFQNMERDQKNVEKFMAEVEDFSKKIKQRAVQKKKEKEKNRKMAEDLGLDTQSGEYEYVELSKEERMGPGGLDPIEVFKTLPKGMQDAFDKQDIPLLQEVLSKMPKDQVAYHMDRCEKSGLWVPNKDDATTPPDAPEGA